MRLDRQDYASLGGLVLCLLGLLFVLLTEGQARPTAGDADAGQARLEKHLDAQARLSMLEQLYAPVLQLRDAGRASEALLHLVDLQKRFSKEPYSELLKGELLLLSGARDQAVVSIAQAVRGNGDLIDDKSPLSRKSLVEALVDEGLPYYKQRAAGGNASARDLLRDLRYLQSRLAGGCE